LPQAELLRSFSQPSVSTLSTAHNNDRNGSAPEVICLSCGLCCNGVIFTNVKLQPGDDSAKLQSIGLTLSCNSRRKQKAPISSSIANSTLRSLRFLQPCAAHDGCHCRIYADRPQYCREFECKLLKSVAAGRTRFGAALGVIRSARQRADKVRRLLRRLGDTDEATALGVRFRRTAKRLEKLGLDGTMAKAYGELTLAFHDLNLILSEAFYPGTNPSSP